jgi:hypothetical protein
MRLSGLFIYPVKGLRGLAVQASEVDALGLAGDRRFLVVDEAGRFLTQRTLPRMTLISTAFEAEHLKLSADRAGAVRVSRASDATAPLRTVSVWKSEGLEAEDCGEEAARFLSDFLGVRCRLVRIGMAFRRPVLKSAAQHGDVLHFGDGAPLLAASEASLVDLNDRIATHGGKPVPMNRFRPNLVIASCPAFAEDGWGRFRIGSVTFRSAGPSARCIVTTTDQLTGERGKEPLRTLATFRRDATNPTNVNFGQNVINESKTGTVQVGDEVELI